jgi:hypothetical protein
MSGDSKIQFRSTKIMIAPHLMMAIAALLLIAFCTACGGTSVQPVKAPPPTQHFNFFRIVDAVDNPTRVQYAYAPSLILENNVYHVFFCSGGNITPAMDYIRYVNSIDGGNTWSSPVDMLHASAFNGTDLSACDPDVVFFQGFYYMFYGSAMTTAPGVTQTVMQVARSSSITGPYLTYTQRNTWDNTPTDPQVIVMPLAVGVPSYGAGQPSMVSLNGKLYMWYIDDSLHPGTHLPRLYMLQSNDPVTWTPDPNQLTDFSDFDSPVVKYDPASQQFVATWILNEFYTDTSLKRAFSSDGLHWSKAEVLITNGQFLPYVNNAGVTTDQTGNMLPGKTIIGFGRPYSQAGIDAGLFDLYGVWMDDH